MWERANPGDEKSEENYSEATNRRQRRLEEPRSIFESRMERDTHAWLEKGKRRNVCLKKHTDGTGLCKSLPYSHLADRFLCHYATAEKLVIPSSHAPLYAAIEITNGESRRTITGDLGLRRGSGIEMR